ncbi:Acetolactate synthase catalytic subunit [Apiospora arundinis]
MVKNIAELPKRINEAFKITTSGPTSIEIDPTFPNVLSRAAIEIA